MFITEIAHALGLVPLAWLVALQVWGHARSTRWWWIASAFGVSFVADTVTEFWGYGDLVNNLYPITQATLFGLVLLPRTDAIHLLGALGLTGLVAVQSQGVVGLEIVLGTVAWLSVAGLAYHTTMLPPLLRWSLLICFGLGWVAWLAIAVVRMRYLIDGVWYGPGWATWGPWLAYQSTRLVAAVLFCLAVLRRETPCAAH